MSKHVVPNHRQAIPGIAAEGLPLIGVGAALTAATAIFSRRLAGIPLLLTAGTAYFFRDPERALPTDASLLYSAADGRVLRVERVEEPRFIKGPALRIATFLSLFDVHVNRSATQGIVRYIEHVPGSFEAAWGDDVHEVNERNYIGLETAHGPVLLIQIAGLVARRIVCNVVPGETVRAGERLGLIKFGSRTDVLAPYRAAQPLVVAGMRVQAGVTPLAAWDE